MKGLGDEEDAVGRLGVVRAALGVDVPNLR